MSLFSLQVRLVWLGDPWVCVVAMWEEPSTFPYIICNYF